MNHIFRCYNPIEMKRIDWSLCLIADTGYLYKTNFIQTIEKSVKEGVTIVQLRSKNTDTRAFLDTALQLSATLVPYGIPLIINDRTDIALACKADGVHLGQKDLPLPFAREIMGKNKIIGITATNNKQAEEAESQGADYIGVGPVFDTGSKKEASKPIGLDQLAIIRKNIKIPILAIGGINPQNAALVLSSGVNGIAVISAILGSADVIASTKNLLKEIRKGKN